MVTETFSHGGWGESGHMDTLHMKASMQVSSASWWQSPEAHRHRSLVQGCAGRQSRHGPSSCCDGCYRWHPLHDIWFLGRSDLLDMCLGSLCSECQTSADQIRLAPC